MGEKRNKNNNNNKNSLIFLVYFFRGFRGDVQRGCPFPGVSTSSAPAELLVVPLAGGNFWDDDSPDLIPQNSRWQHSSPSSGAATPLIAQELMQEVCEVCGL